MVEQRTVAGLKWNFVPVEIDLEDFIGPFKTHLRPHTKKDWSSDQDLTFKFFADGITNKLVGVYPRGYEDDMVLLRINGNNTETFINRELEIMTMITLHEAGLAQHLYCQFSNGICYGYAPGRIVTLDEMKDPEFKVGKCVAKTLAKLHHVHINPHFGIRSRLWEFFDWLDKVPSEYDTPDKQLKYEQIYGGSTDILRGEITELKKELDNLDPQLVFCHNDLLAGNLIYNKERETVTLVDFEYGGPNYRAYDIADYFCEYAGIDVSDIDYGRYPDEAHQKKWIEIYLQESALCEGKSPNDVTAIEIHKLYREVNKCALAAHLMWAVWALLQAKYSSIDFDYISYSKIRFDEYLARKKLFLSL